MLKAVGRHVSPATIVALVALVFAMSGGAYALTGSGSAGGAGQGASGAGGKAVASAAKAKKKGKSKSTAGKAGPRGAEGKQGPEGKQGAAGPEGKAGATGPAGSKGEAGAAGGAGEKGAPGTPGSAGAALKLVNETPSSCVEGGYTYEVSGSGEANEVCNGEKGVLHPHETLPEGATETGAFSTSEPITTGASETQEVLMPVSFPIMLKTQSWTDLEFLEDHYEYVEADGTHVGFPSAKGQCKGSAAEPSAPEGFFCVYAGVESANGKNNNSAGWKGLYGEGVVESEYVAPRSPDIDLNPKNVLEGIGLAAAGARLSMIVNGGQSGVEIAGTWAVTGF